MKRLINNNRKSLYLIPVIMLILVLVIALYTRNKSFALEDVIIITNGNDDIKFALFRETHIENDYEELTESNAEFPVEGYELNMNLSKCTNEDGETLSNVLSYDYDNSKVIVSTSEEAFCYLYFSISPSFVTFTYDYTNTERVLEVPYTGYYKLETWGAQGGNNSDNSSLEGGLGGYSTGYIRLTAGTRLYIHTGGKGASSKGTGSTGSGGGYNGGGNGGCFNNTCVNVGGGGATHIALVSGQLRNLSAYKGTLVNNRYYESDQILMVAGGGGGNQGDGYQHNYNGSGGGHRGQDTWEPSCANALGGTQLQSGTANGNTTSGGFGYGGSGGASGCPGGGGGFFGGGDSFCWWPHNGAGGSGYIANPNLIGKHMTCYNCDESNVEATKTTSVTCMSSTPTEDCAKKDNGYARISFKGPAITKIRIQLDPKGGSLDSNEIELIYNDNYSLPTPQASGKIFMGWYTDDNIRVNESMKVSKSIRKLTARWDEGQTIDYIRVGNFNTGSETLLDIKNYTNRWQDLTLNNFFMQGLFVSLVGENATAYTTDSLKQILDSYNAETGMLKINEVHGRWGNKLDFNLYIILNPDNKIHLGEYTSQASNTLDLRGRVSNYNKLTFNHFFIQNGTMSYTYYKDSNHPYSVLRNYNSSSGILDLNKAIYAGWISATENQCYYANYDLYVFEGTLNSLE